MDNDTAYVYEAIELYIHKHGRPPSNYSQIKLLAETLARPNTLDPVLKFEWKVSGPIKDRDDPTKRRLVITVIVHSPDHEAVSESADYPLDEEPLVTPPKGIKY